MNAIERYEQLKAKVDKLRRKADNAQGALDHQLKQLKTNFNCDSINDAKKLLKKLQQESTKTSNDFAAKLDAFEKTWGSILDDENE